MAEYTEGEMLMTIKIKETFVLEIEQNGEKTELVSGVTTQDLHLATKLKLQFFRVGGSVNFVWRDQMTILRG